MPAFFWQKPSAPHVPRLRLIVVTSAIVIASLAVRPAWGQNASIGLYTDATGSSCNFTGDSPGIVTAYVVVRPGGIGVTAVQFSAPLPNCFGATYLGEVVPANAIAIGNSQTGVSIALTACTLQPTSVLQISFQRVGGTSPCCAYPILPDPALTEVLGADCTFQSMPVSTMTSRFNADESCPCTGNSGPDAPSIPFPPDNAVAQSYTPLMSWYASDPDGNLSEFDVYLGTTAPPPLAASNLTDAHYAPPALGPMTQYYWRVVARDAFGLESSGPTWTFGTRATNTPPSAPTPLGPIDGAWGVLLNADLSWTASDADLDALTYDIYFGTDPTPPLVGSDLVQASYDPGTMNVATVYYWRVVASDGTDETSGPVWSFETRTANTAPSVPTNPQPPNGTGINGVNPVLSWWAEDSDGDALVYNVYFGTTSPIPLVAQGLTQPMYVPGMLNSNTTYYWRVVASDGQLQTQGPLWSFHTGGPGNTPPLPPANPVPVNGQVDVSVNQVLSWTISDPDGDPLVQRVYFGTSPSPPLVAQNWVSTTFDPGTLATYRDYYWRIVVSDGTTEVSGPVWTFRTETNDIPPGSTSIGLYSNPTGTLCSFTGDGPGLVTAHVILRPGPGGATATQFAAPVPLCFGAVFLGENVPAGMLMLGTSQTGVSIAIGDCVDEPVKVLEITYMRAGGASATCCPYPILAHPIDGTIAATDCTYDFYIVPGVTSYFNANASCQCGSAPNAPSVPSNPQPTHEAVGIAFAPVMSWFASDVDGNLAEFDVYMGTSSPPPLVAAGLVDATYTPAPLQPLTEYFWRVVARDTDGLETSGPVWSFTTRLTNAPPFPPASPNPFDGQTAVALTASLSWLGGDPESDPIAYDVYFGAAPNPPLTASDLTAPTFSPGALQVDTQYYWRVVAKDGSDETSGPTWTFRTILVGDVVPDGQLTLADADCALRLGLLDFGCGGAGASDRADVDCSARVTPRDARCIHKKVVDGSCTFCGGGSPPAPAALLPALFVGNTFREGDEVVARVYVSGVPSLEAFGFHVRLDANVSLARVLPFGATTVFEALRMTPSLLPPFLPAAVGGYTLGSVPAASDVGLVELRFTLTSGDVGFAYIESAFDDLLGANQVVIYLDDGSNLPVLITRFEAVRSGSDIEVRWDFASDEPVGTFTLYRRDQGTALPVAIAEGPADATRSFLDRAVASGTTYRYQLLVRTRDGEEYRSQTATVTTADLALGLGQNHPNPFNPQTTIPFDIPGGGATHVRLFILDAAGRIVARLVDETMPGGSHQVVWTGRDQRGGAVSSGVYFYVLDVGGERRTRKLVLLK